ncbi:MAG: hypothetical protein IKZ49_00645 [Alphaproteobacteria bacterium]|nr:hypothetical protein [Alphaproteobacteria bacterium]
MALTTMPFSAFALLVDNKDCTEYVENTAFKAWGGITMDAGYESFYSEYEKQVYKDTETIKFYKQTKYKEILALLNQSSKGVYEETYISPTATGISKCHDEYNNEYILEWSKCTPGITPKECNPGFVKICYEENKRKADRTAEAEYTKAMIAKVCNGNTTNNNIHTAQENKLPAAANTSSKAVAKPQSKPTSSVRASASPAPTASKAGGGAGPKKVIKPTQPATPAVATPYAATNATVANPAYEDGPRPAHENIEKLNAPINTPAAVKASDVNIVAKLPCEQEIRKYPHATGISGTTPNCVITDCEDDYKVSRDKKSCEEMVNADYPDDYACEILENGQYDAANNNCECPESNEGWDSVHKICSASASRKTFDSSTQTTEPEQKTKKQLKQEAKDKKAQEKSAQNGCSNTGGKWENNACKCPANNIWNASLQQCVVSRDAKIEACKKYGTWNDDMGTCNCKDSLAWSESSLKCVASDKLDIKDLSESQCNNREGVTWDPTEGVCVALNQNGCTDGDKNCNKVVKKAQKNMEKDINTLTKAFFEIVKRISKSCENKNSSFKDGECVPNPTEEQTTDANNANNKRTSGAKAGKGKKNK